MVTCHPEGFCSSIIQSPYRKFIMMQEPILTAIIHAYITHGFLIIPNYTTPHKSIFKFLEKFSRKIYGQWPTRINQVKVLLAVIDLKTSKYNPARYNHAGMQQILFLQSKSIMLHQHSTSCVLSLIISGLLMMSLWMLSLLDL